MNSSLALIIGFIASFFFGISSSQTSAPPSPVETVISAISMEDYYYDIPYEYVKVAVPQSTVAREKILTEVIKYDKKNAGETGAYNPADDNNFAIIDNAHGFFSLWTGSINEDDANFCVDCSKGVDIKSFTKKDWGMLLAVQSDNCGLWCKPGQNTFYILEKSDSQWKNVTATYFPDTLKKEIQAKLSQERNGQTIEMEKDVSYQLDMPLPNIGIYHQGELMNYELQWDGAHFSLIQLSAQ
ncbi:hypothetical protein KBD59_02560 [Candidatus Gracilibacteria bacterium]|nr:hypothetical protein [Candidatus Gracilibacteria bacterium]